MSVPGAGNPAEEARGALLDALEALDALRDAVILVGAQAIYLYTGEAPVAIAAFTKDTDIALDTRRLLDDPRIEEAMRGGGFVQALDRPQPGAWISPSGIPVDVMIAEAQAGDRGRRSIDVPPHAPNAARRALGLEAALVDHRVMEIASLADTDPRSFSIRVAGPAALLVAKMHKIGERLASPRWVNSKDAHDVYRLLVARSADEFVAGFTQILGDPLSGDVGRAALDYLREAFAPGPNAAGSILAGRAEEGVGAPDMVAASVSILAADLLEHLDAS